MKNFNFSTHRSLYFITIIILLHNIVLKSKRNEKCIVLILICPSLPVNILWGSINA